MTTLAATGGWDCHAHLFGPYAQYPLAEGRNYTPPEASQAEYDAVLAQLGLGHGVLVHPSAYGLAYERVLDALAARPAWRGVLVAQKDTTLDLKSLRARGVRALRYSHRGGAAANFAGSASLDDLVAMAPALADAGLHAEMWTDRQVLPAIADTLRALPVPVVLDHMAGFDAAGDIDEAGFSTLRQLLSEGHIWVKLSAYRNMLTVAPSDWATVGRPFHQALVSANPAQLLWGSDWPFLNVKQPPDAGQLFALLEASVGDAGVVRRVLVDNPSSLYT